MPGQTETGVGDLHGLRLVCKNLSSDIYKFANRLRGWTACATSQGVAATVELLLKVSSELIFGSSSTIICCTRRGKAFPHAIRDSVVHKRSFPHRSFYLFFCSMFVGCK